VTGSSKGNRGSGSLWLNDSKHNGTVTVKGEVEEKGSLHGVGVLLL
jgi:hypothetical protein